MQALLFPAIRAEIKTIVAKVLWVEFKKTNTVLVEECTSFVLEKLVLNYGKIVRGKERSFIYSVAKHYFQDWLFERNSKTVFIQDLLLQDEDQPDRIKYLKTEDRSNNELEELKTEAVNKFQELIQRTDDRNSILTICALMECVLTQYDYNQQFLSLYLYRKTNLKYDVLYRTMKSMNLKLVLSRQEWFEKIFKMYASIEPSQHSGGIISDWERRAIFYFENRHERFKGKNFESRHNRVSKKTDLKSTPQERIYWMKTYRGGNMEGDYYNSFGMSYRTFKSDKRAAFN